MSYIPIYSRMLRGSSCDPNDLDFCHRRTLRSHSCLPESLYLRGYDSIPNSLVQRGLSTAREILEEPSPSLKALDYVDYYDTTNTLSRCRESMRRSDDYWLNRYTDNITRPRTSVYVSSTTGRSYPLYAPSRRFPSSYWSYYPYSSTLPTSSIYNYGRKYWSLNDTLNDGYLHNDPYTTSKGITRLTWRNWALENPHTSYAHYYRPRYPVTRTSYLYPRYI